MQAYYFGEAGRQLFACFDPSASPLTHEQHPAVLLIGPHGQEAVRAHRMLRVLADRLARLGLDVLRFDAFGSGDSAGDDEELSLTGWRDDVLSAAAELDRRTEGRAQIWIGFRLGATVACMAADGSESVRPSALALVEPVEDGPAYLGELASATVRLLEASMSVKDPLWRTSLRQDPQRWQREAVGFAMGERLHVQLQGLTADSLAVSAGIKTTVIVPSPQARDRVLAVPWARTCRVLTVLDTAYQFDWTAEEAVNSALVPNQLLAALTEFATRSVEAV